jgi:tryptophan 2,3-dioxygenase
MRLNTQDCYYPEYLKLSTLLDCQKPVSGQYGPESHDETLFIIVHQVYELWFKQMLHEVKSIIKIFSTEKLAEGALGLARARVERLSKIQKILIDQFSVLETMTPEDFLDFRDYLIPASGFQSYQFRELEIRLGLKREARVKFDVQSFNFRLSDEHQNYLKKIETEPSLFEVVQRWLERTPFLQVDNFDFWQEYKKSVELMLKSDLAIIRNNPHLPENEKQLQVKEFEATQRTFDDLFSENETFTHESDAKPMGMQKLSKKATKAALFIRLYHDQPVLIQPFQLLFAIIDFDEHLTTWRYKHSLLAHRMLGTKIGTGGSTGHHYLRATTQSNRIFSDLFNLSTYLIPKNLLPELPKSLKKKLNFHE